MEIRENVLFLCYAGNCVFVKGKPINKRGLQFDITAIAALCFHFLWSLIQLKRWLLKGKRVSMWKETCSIYLVNSAALAVRLWCRASRKPRPLYHLNRVIEYSKLEEIWVQLLAPERTTQNSKFMSESIVQTLPEWGCDDYRGEPVPVPDCLLMKIPFLIPNLDFPWCSFLLFPCS